jgi:alkylation response protein AidB-like acyl-CoA dehydrogenase
MTQEWIARAREVASSVLARHASEVDRLGRWPVESMTALGQSGLLGLTVPAAFGGGGEGPTTFARVTQTLAAQCASTAMIYLMHVCGTQVIASAPSLPEGEGLAAMMKTVLPWFQLGSAAVSVGLSRTATEATRQHLRTSRLEHLGQALSALPNLRARLAQMQVVVDTQEAFMAHVAASLENPGPATLVAVLESKAAAAEAALQVTDLAMRTCGGAAFSGQLTVERNFRDARAASVMAPTTDALYDFLGKALLDLPLF